MEILDSYQGRIDVDAGIIDKDYQEIIGVLLINNSKKKFIITTVY